MHRFVLIPEIIEILYDHLIKHINKITVFSIAKHNTIICHVALNSNLVNVAARFVIHLFRAIEYIHHHSQSSSEIFRCLCFSSSCRSGWWTSHDQMKTLCESNVTAICQWGDDKPRCITEVFMPILELGIANVCKTIPNFFIPPMSELRLPHKG